jgi:hypothetical protein
LARHGDEGLQFGGLDIDAHFLSIPRLNAINFSKDTPQTAGSHPLVQTKNANPEIP